MKTIFDPSNCEDLLRRVDSIPPGSGRQWGKMSAAQMLEHTARALEVATGRRPTKQAFLGKLIGWRFRKDFVGEKPFRAVSTDILHVFARVVVQAYLDRLTAADPPGGVERR
jgi:hypothetical protein